MTTTNQTIPSTTQESREAVDERLRQAVLDKRQSEIEAWNRQIEELRSGLSNLTEDARQEIEKRVDQLLQARDQGMEQLQRLQEATQDNWQQLLEQSDATFGSLADRFHALVESNG
ncbi:MAG: hypothetical protein AAFX65_13885 [Cyanobacteria bacterium J06638_7]